MIEIVETRICPYCGSDNVVYNLKGQLICRDCGLIFEPLARLPPKKATKTAKKKTKKKKTTKKKTTKKKTTKKKTTKKKKKCRK